MIGHERYAGKLAAASEDGLGYMIQAAYRVFLKTTPRSRTCRVAANERIDQGFLECQARSRMEVFVEARTRFFKELDKNNARKKTKNVTDE